MFLRKRDIIIIPEKEEYVPEKEGAGYNIIIIFMRKRGYLLHNEGVCTSQRGGYVEGYVPEAEGAFGGMFLRKRG